MRPKLSGLRFRCTRCEQGRLAQGETRLTCPTCDAVFPIENGRPIFHTPVPGQATNRLDRLKSRFKRFETLYRFLVYLISPLYFDGTRRRFLQKHVKGRSGTFVNLGSGNTHLDEGLINIDMAAYDNVDIVCDIGTLPLESDSVDLLMNISVLEHTPDPERVVREIRRVLRPGGIVYTDVPFVVGFHASPSDFNRWTDDGVKQLHREFEIISLTPNGGPTSALLWVFQEWVAITFSFGSKSLHMLLYLLVMVATFPVKFLDVILKHSPLARNISSCFILVGRKPQA